jgi:protein SCO1/2
MTMTFSVHDPKEIASVRTGDAISFRMVVTDQDLFLDHVKKIAADDVRLAAHTPRPTSASNPDNRLREGDQLPPFVLMGQNGERLTKETFQGQSLILTFIFTRCPVPNFCPRMSNNFADLQKAIQNGEISNVHLLSISLDPAFDTPYILKQYAEYHGADPNIWTFATGEVDGLIGAFSIYRQNEGGTITHGLATALVDGDGKVVKIWRGNGWTPAEVIDASRSLTKTSATN